MLNRDLRTWVEIDELAAQSNARLFRSMIDPKVKLWAVVKSNAYGHGIFDMPPLLSKTGLVDGFCVDSLVEGVKLREMGIKEPILVLGFTLPDNFRLAVERDIIITISNRDILSSFLKSKIKPKFHIKVDTGMHRQGFLEEEILGVAKRLRSSGSDLKNNFLGVYTHFASGKDINYPTYTDMQLESFLRVCGVLERAGFKNLMRHVAATAGTMVSSKYHLDAVRVGIGFYGLPPSKELEIQRNEFKLKPVLSWRTIVSEIKNIKKGGYVGYDLVERVVRDSKIAVLPIGYWHGYPRALSGVGQVLIKGKRARVLGRVSMDMIVADATDIDCGFGDEVTLIGCDGKEEITAQEFAALAGGASYYEIVTRINPLIQRVIWKKGH